ncbi:MAG: cytochrome c biogenesis protein CcsA [Ignavibacterium sp.]
MAASILVWIAFGAALMSAFAYHQSATKKRMLVPLARRSFLVMAAGVVAASMLLMMFILRHQFEYSYVWNYSSRDLPVHLLLTTFWAGQEGSFMFWALCSTIIGFGLLNFTRRKHIEYETMAVYALLQAFLLLLLLVKSPFRYIWEAFPDQVQVGFVPPDGKGLNPLLQNFWMIIHPPVLFIGFAAMGVPFAMAVAALWRRSYSEWVVKALPWTMFAAIALGAGLMFGGYWAYGVLGWGGWWGWDPVENSSLIPWIVVVALLHTLLVQKKTGKLMRTNFILAVLGFVLVIYSTFLTRSGILGDASVHSFVDPGAFAYALLVLWMLTVTLLGFGMVFTRWKELKTLGSPVGSFSRESLIALGSAALGASAVVIFFGTSLPIVSPSTVEPSFYDSMNLPIAAIMLVILGISLLVQWRVDSPVGLGRRSLRGILIAVVGTLGLFAAGVRDFSMLALAVASLFALVVNVERLIALARVNPAGTGGAIAHIGLALLFLGIIGSGRYGQKVTASLPQNEPKEVFGRTVTYTGAEPFENGTKYRFRVSVERNGSTTILSPVMFQSSYNNSLMREPDYTSSLTSDFYLEPVAVEATHDHASDGVYEFAKGAVREIEGKSITFVRFEMSKHGNESMVSGEGFSVSAVVEVRAGKKTETLTVPAVFRQGQAPEPTPVKTRDGALEVSFLGMNIDVETKQSTIQLSIRNPKADVHDHTRGREVLVVEASLKPFMNLVWIAAVLVLGGLALALSQTRKQILPPSPNGRNGKERELKTALETEVLDVAS